jgi:P27 family predicted phage terminase small subunit
MGLRGPPKEPSKILSLRGSWRADQRVGEPEVAPKIVPAPDWLPEDEHEAYDKLCKLLNASKLIGEIDADTVARLVFLKRQFRIGVAGIEAQGHTMETAKGTKQSPEFKCLLEICTAIDRMERTFGITPSARAGLSIMIPTKVQRSQLGADYQDASTG